VCRARVDNALDALFAVEGAIRYKAAPNHELPAQYRSFMGKSNKDQRPDARLPKGFRDSGAQELRALGRMLAAIREVYETYGFEPLETPAIEYTEALGKFLPDQDRPN
jgi:hypothetical protein